MLSKATLPEQFCRVSQRFPVRIALQNASEEVAYGDLKNRIGRIGAYFRRIGISPGDRVALLIDNSIDYVVALYATWKTGAVVVALNPQAKTHEVKARVRHCQAKCLVIERPDSYDLDRFQLLNVTILSLAETHFNSVLQWEDAIACEDDDIWHETDESTPAQIIYTSGTTGDPKGVLLSHGNLMWNVKDIVSYLRLDETDSILQVLPFHYSYGNSVLHTHLSVGAKVILAGSMAFPQDIVNSIRKHAVSGFSGVPSTFALLLTRSDWPSNKPALRYVTQAGGAMSAKLTEELVQACHPETRLVIMYGQTEAAARISWLPPEDLNVKPGSAGIPVEHVEMQIRNEQGQKVAAHEEGEVYVRGPSIMQGYWNNPEATGQVFVEGWLKTGDLGHLDEDGYLFLAGRNSEMIKVGAHRVNPLEIEEVIDKLSFISESAVVGIADNILGQKLHAFVVGEKTRENILSLKRHCREYLPLYKVPAEFRWLTRLPRTASGKIKRFKLNT